jgi:excisionase family DNA binding protein
MELLNVHQGARELNVSVHTLRSWISKRRIPIIRLGRKVLLRREDLEDFVAKNTVKAGE